MPLLQTLTLEHLPPSHEIHITLFRSIQNAGFLHQQLLEGNKEFEYAFIDASVIISKTHILSAVYRAVNDALEERLKSRNVHSEIVFSLANNNNIAESFRRFGIQPTTTDLIAIKVSTTTHPFKSQEVQAHLEKSVEGTQVEFSDDELLDMTDWARVRKIYKLNSGGGSGGKKGVNGVAKDEERERRDMEVLVLGSMALRGAGS